MSIWNEGIDIENYDDYRLHMNGRAIFNFVIDTVPKSISRCLENHPLTIADIDYFLFHQASKPALTALSSEMNLPSSKVLSNLDKIGNTTSSTIPILLSQNFELFQKQKSIVVCSGFGVGLSWGTTILNFN